MCEMHGRAMRTETLAKKQPAEHAYSENIRRRHQASIIKAFDEDRRRWKSQTSDLGLVDIRDLQPSFGSTARAVASAMAEGARLAANHEWRANGHVITKAEIPASTFEDAALRLAEAETAALVGNLTEEARQAIAQFISLGLAEDQSIQTVIRNIREATMLSLRQRTLIARMSLDGDIGARAITREAKRQHRKRATVIARTEIMKAKNAGTILSWGEMDRRGIIEPGAQKEWIAFDECKICEAIVAKGPVPLREDFVSDDVGRLSAPPAHPNCRCTVGLVFP